ncbi:MAG: dihydrodipicolinate synthase family protein [Variovorax sp.]
MKVAPQTAAEFHGIYPMIYAFYDAQGRLDRAAMRRQIEACVAGGVHGVAILGIVTEFNKLDVNERRTVVEWTAEDLAGRLPLAVTINEHSVHGQLEMARLAAEVRADWLILQPPAIRNIAEPALVSFFGKVADAATLPVAVQNNPMNLDVWLSNAGLLALNRNHPNVSLLKGEGPIEYVRRLVEETGHVFRIFNGRGGLELPNSVRLGCAGLIPAPECADVMARVYDLMRSGEAEKIDAAERLHAQLLPLLTYVMASPEHMLCYGKRLFAQRIGLAPVEPREPCIMPGPFGMDVLSRYGAVLPAWGADMEKA